MESHNPNSNAPRPALSRHQENPISSGPNTIPLPASGNRLNASPRPRPHAIDPLMQAGQRQNLDGQGDEEETPVLDYGRDGEAPDALARFAARPGVADDAAREDHLYSLPKRSSVPPPAPAATTTPASTDRPLALLPPAGPIFRLLPPARTPDRCTDGLRPRPHQPQPQSPPQTLRHVVPLPTWPGITPRHTAVPPRSATESRGAPVRVKKSSVKIVCMADTAGAHAVPPAASEDGPGSSNAAPRAVAGPSGPTRPLHDVRPCDHPSRDVPGPSQPSTALPYRIPPFTQLSQVQYLFLIVQCAGRQLGVEEWEAAARQVAGAEWGAEISSHGEGGVRDAGGAKPQNVEGCKWDGELDGGRAQGKGKGKGKAVADACERGDGPVGEDRSVTAEVLEDYEWDDEVREGKGKVGPIEEKEEGYGTKLSMADLAALERLCMGDDGKEEEKNVESTDSEL